MQISIPKVTVPLPLTVSEAHYHSVNLHSFNGAVSDALSITECSDRLLPLLHCIPYAGAVSNASNYRGIVTNQTSSLGQNS